MKNLQVAIKAVQIYAEAHPRPLHVSQKQAAEMLNVSIPTVRKLVAFGTLKLNDLGSIPISEIDSALMPRAA